MTRSALLNDALVQARALQLRYPGARTIASIARQLTYLVELESGGTNDRSRLSDIILGVQAAREIEPLDMDLAETLYKVSSEVKLMQELV